MRGNQWLRAIRPAARHSRQALLATRTIPIPSANPLTARSFHASSVAGAGRGSGRSNPGPGSDLGDDGDRAPQDSERGSKPEGEKEATDNKAGEETRVTGATGDRLFGEDTVPADGESHGRKRPTTGLRSRMVRTRKSDLPPVQIPESFLDVAIHRHGKAKTSPSRVDTPEHSRENGSQDTHVYNPLGWSFRQDLFDDAASIARAILSEAPRVFESGADVSPIIRWIDVLGDSAYWATLNLIKAQYGDDAYARTIESMPPPQSLGLATTLLRYQAENIENIHPVARNRLLLYHLIEHGEAPLARPYMFEPCIIDEIVTTLRAECFIQAPRNIRLTNVQRPTTIINLQDCTGFSTARDIIQYIAGEIGADVLHLRVHDIARIVGRYIGQDATRTPGEIALLGYKTAENSGRLKQRPAVEEETEETEASYEIPITYTIREDKGRKDVKRQTMSMDEFLQSSGTRGKSEELWEDMKINAALDELIHSADVEGTERKPLIVHINDINALSMDETGAVILNKIRKVVDDLWLSGRKAVLVGSCSTNEAPKAYQTTLTALETSERVVHLSKRRFPDSQLNITLRMVLRYWEMKDYVRENDENLVGMLWSMTESQNPTPKHIKGTLGLEDRLYSWGSTLNLLRSLESSVLPMTEIYRIAVTMIGLSSTGSVDLFSLDCFDEAMKKIKAVDDASEVAAAREKRTAKLRRHLRDEAPTGKRRTDPYAEDHEDKLMSGMVHAKDMRTTFKDIHAPQETIESIKMLTTLSLIRPEAFSYGVLASDRIPGCLLYGPPGTGKTLLAKAVAKESGANMIEISGASINNMYVGESEKNVRALFRLARRKEPMVIFIDEADALLGARGGRQNGARRETINQFLREWDGMDKMKAFIMVATNRPFDLDEAVLRRLPRKLLIDLPLEPDRAAILRIHLKGETLDEKEVSIENLAKRTPLYSGSDLKNMCVAAAMAAVKEELEASERHAGPEPFQWAPKRILGARHFDKALAEIGASVSEDMTTLTAIRKFDERYGDGRARKRRKGIGFEVVPEALDSERVLVRGVR